MNNIKIAFFDIDGTLSNNDKIITEETYKALQYLKDNNILLVLASGRYDKYALEYNKYDIFDYLIANNGAEILDIKNDKILYSDIINNKLDEIINFLNKDSVILLNSKDKQYSINDKYDDKNIYQVVVINKTKEDVRNIIEFANKNELKITYISSAYFKEEDVGRYTTNINLNKTSKGNAIKQLFNILNINKEESICFGDNYNDISMFNECGIKVAMSNSSKEILDMADYITISNQENGVAHFINNNMKKQD